MSGAKVVRVLTKQEVMAICQGRIDALHDEIKEWRKCAIRHDALRNEDEKQVESRFSAILEMFASEKFKDVPKNCIAEIASLRQDMERIRRESIARVERERSLRRRLQYSAETLIQSFETSGRVIPNELQKIASSVVTVQTSELPTLGSVLNRISTEYALNIVGSQDLTPLQKELSKNLSDGEKIQTLVEWKINQEGKSTSVVESRLDKLLAEIEALESRETAKPFLDRLELIAKQSSSTRRSLLTDSLILDLVAHANIRKEIECAISSLREIRSELRRLSSKTARDLEAILTQAIDAQDISNNNSLKERCIKLIKEETQIMAGVSRREAILKGLAELGYEVQENMVTAWVKNGRIVVRKPNEKTYGIEVGAVADVERVQIQLVTFEKSDEASKASRDRDRETIWCNEFSRLRGFLEKSGTSLEIEKAIPVGAKPVKQVEERESNNSVREMQSNGSITKQNESD